MKNKEKSLFYIYFWCLSFLKKYIPYILGFLIFNGISKFCTMQIPLAMQKFIDKNLINGQKSDVDMFATTIVVLVVIQIATYAFSRFFELVFVEKGTRNIQWKIIQKTRDLGVGFFESTPIGETLSLLNNSVISVYFLYSKYLCKTISLLLSILISIFMIINNASISIILLSIACCAIFFVANLIYAKKFEITNYEYSQEKQKSDGVVYTCVQSLFEMKAFNSQNWIKNQIIDYVKKLNIKALSLLRIIGKRKLIVASLYSISTILFFVINIELVNNGTCTVGMVVANYSYVNILYISFSQIIDLINEEKKNLFEARKLYELTLRKDGVIDNGTVESIEHGNIKLEEISFEYINGRRVLNNLSLEIKKGEKIALVGESGSGKSTLFKLISRTYELGTGKIYIDDILIRNYCIHTLREKIGIAFQEKYLFALSILENIRFGDLDATNNQIINLCQQIGADKFINDLPNGYETILSERGQSLSGGEIQKIILARTLIKKPEILLLDEVTSDLDYISEKTVLDYILSEFNEKTVIMATHRLSVIKRMDRIIVMEKGRIVESGTYEELSATNGQFSQLIHQGVVKDEESSG